MSKPLWMTWPGPPGCTCDLTKPAKDRCTKGGWMRCHGATQLFNAQMRYRDKVGTAGGDHALAVGTFKIKSRRK
jgi:hypothetical protein